MHATSVYAFMVLSVVACGDRPVSDGPMEALRAEVCCHSCGPKRMADLEDH